MPHQREKQAVRDVRRQVKVFVYGLLLAVVVLIANHDLARRRIDRCLHRMLERRTFLDDMVAQEAKFTALREKGRLVVERAVLEVKDQMTLHAIAFCDLCQLTVREALAFEGA